MYKTDIDEVLMRHLGPVAAPEKLWQRLENPQVSARVPARHAGVRAPLAVAAALVIIAVLFHPRREQARGTVEIEYRLPEHNLTLRVSKATQSPELLNAACLLCHAGV